MSIEVSSSNTTGNSIEHNDESIYANVQDHYSKAAKGYDTNYGHSVASEFGYSKEELTQIPEESNLGLSCGNPFALAKLREGETVIDLGSGAGFDVFQAASKVGASGRAIGIDMNKEMLSRAEAIKASTNASNASFVESRITEISLPDNTANCIISNCVINLVPSREKHLVFSEMYRLLKPRGRVAISDILLKQDLPESLKSSISLYVGCISGASRLDEFERHMTKAGFRDIQIVADRSDLNIYKTANEDGVEVGCCGSTGKSKSSCSGGSNTNEEIGKWKDVDFNEWAGSYKIYAIKPDHD